jgi:hypothetical protein
MLQAHLERLRPHRGTGRGLIVDVSVDTYDHGTMAPLCIAQMLLLPAMPGCNHKARR